MTDTLTFVMGCSHFYGSIKALIYSDTIDMYNDEKMITYNKS